MRSLTGKIASTRGWALLFILFLGAGLLVAACGDEDSAPPTTPAPPPPPQPDPEPDPEPPAVPTGLRINASGEDFIEWTWTAVAEVSGYDVQYSADEAFSDDDDVIARTTEQTTYRRDGLAPGTSGYLRVRSAGGTGEDRITSDWSTHVTGMTMAAAPELPPAPANLRVRERGSDFIEWEWDAVAGADGYESEFSTDGMDFVALQSHPGMNATSRRVSNLEPESEGYLRVRSYTGTGTGADTVRGDWSASNRQSTVEPQPAVPLDAPEGLEATDETDESITLAWDDVDNAESYEVEQRVVGEDWEEASCDGGGNEVDDTECVAGDLASGTDYDFRVRAVPSDTVRYATSGWSDIAETRTEGTAPGVPGVVPGGAGALNVTWTADDSEITWSWDPTAGATYEWHVLTANLDFGAAAPCANVEFAAKDSGTQFSVSSSSADTALLCVRTKTTGGDGADLSWAFATRAPANQPSPGDVVPDAGSGSTTRALQWTGIDVPADFRYDINIVAEGGGVSTPPTGASLQAACSAGTLHESDDSDVDLDGLTTSLRNGLQPYTGYLLCLRYGNQTGATEWVAASDNHYTAPDRPPTPTKDSALSSDDRDTNSETIVWHVATRGASGVPRTPAGYNFRVISHPSRNADKDDNDNLHNDTVTVPTAATCGDSDFETGDYEIDTSPTTALTSTGFTVEFDASRPATEVQTGVSGGEPVMSILPNIVSLCVQAEYNGERHLGPWSISGRETIEPANEKN